MQCPFCKKTFETTLSVCPSCGKMPTQHETGLRIQSIEKINTSELELEIGEGVAATTAPLESQEANNAVSLEDRIEMFRQKRTKKTSLLEFPNKRNEWRDEIKNLVQRRKDGGANETENDAKTPESKPKTAAPKTETALVINLKPNFEEQSPQQPDAKRLIGKALARIEKSRLQFDGDAASEAFVAQAMQTAPLTVTVETPNARNEELNYSVVAPRTANVHSFRILPAIDDDAPEFSDEQSKPERKSIFSVPQNLPVSPQKLFERETSDVYYDLESDEAIAAAALKTVRGANVRQPAMLDVQTPTRKQKHTRRRESQTGEDYAPLAPRFIAGTIDFALCAVITAAVLHFVFGFWQMFDFGISQIVFAAAIFAVMMFLYQTAALFFIGKTAGSFIFGQQTVAVETGCTPSLTQAVLNSAFYLLTLLTGGLGLLPACFSVEKRALHDWLSGTVTVSS